MTKFPDGGQMIGAFLFGIFLAGPAKAQEIPKASYKLELEDYNLELVDYQFPSKLRILFQSERTQPIVAITSVIDRGSEYDQPGMDGIAHVVEHLAFRANHGGIKNWDLIKQMGGSINASTSVDWTNYMTVAPRDALLPLLRIEALRMKDGVKNVTEQDVFTEVEIARNELRMRYENAAVGAAWDEIGKALFPADHPYARSTIGDHETLSNINLKAVQEYVKDNYKPEYTTIVVAGDFDLQEAGNIIFDAFAGNEDLLMSPEDAAAYNKVKTENARIKFLNKWFPKLQQHLQNATRAKPRVDCGNRKAPPVPQQKKGDKIPVVKGMTDSKNVIVAWSLPGGYCADQGVMQMAGYMLSSYVLSSMFPSPDDQRKNADKVGCFASTEEYNSSMICFVDKSAKGLSRLSDKKVADKVKDALALQWQQYDPNMINTMVQRFFNGARSQQMAGILQSVDSVASLYGGRATTTAMYTHFTGDAAYFSASMNALNTIKPEAVRKIGEDYITRDRAVTVVVEPMDEEERQRREATAQKTSRSEEVKEYHATQESDRYTSLFPVDKVTDKLLEQQVVTPDLSKLKKFTMENGLDVAILPYGDAPLVRVGLRIKGDPGRISTPVGLDSYVERSYYTGEKSREQLLAIAGFMSATSTSMSISASSGNLDAVLNKLRWQLEDFKFVSGNSRKKWLKNNISSTKNNSKKAINWSSRVMRQSLFPDHRLGYWMRPSDYENLLQLGKEDIKEWWASKWQPANTELILVGKLDQENAEKLVREYFGNWRYKGSGKPAEMGTLSKPTKNSKRAVYLFDKPIATQTEIAMMCQLDVDHHLYDRPKTDVVSDVMSEAAWRALREEAGVTYGAGAYSGIYQGGGSYLAMQSLVQNDATGFAINKMLEIVAAAAKGDVKKESIANSKMKIARTFVLGQQSGDQMLSRLSNTGIQNFDFFDKFAGILASVTKDDFKKVLKPCKGNEVFTVVGPIDNAKKQLEKAGIEYVVFDWEGEYKKLLTPKELKKYEKAKAKKEKTKKK